MHLYLWFCLNCMPLNIIYINLTYYIILQLSLTSRSLSLSCLFSVLILNRVNPLPKSHASWPCSDHTHSNYSRSTHKQETHIHMHSVAQTRSCAPLITSSTQHKHSTVSFHACRDTKYGKKTPTNHLLLYHTPFLLVLYPFPFNRPTIHSHSYLIVWPAFKSIGGVSPSTGAGKRKTD